MNKSVWTGAVDSDWADADNWSLAGVPGAGADVTITAIGTVNSIADSSDLYFARP